MKVGAMAVSHWEKGDNPPAAEIYVKLGRIAGDPWCWYFWEQIGLTKNDIVRIMPDLEQRLYKCAELKIEVIAAPGALWPGTTQLKKRPDAVAVPLLRDAAAAGPPLVMEQAEVEETLVIPRPWCPHPKHTACIHVSGRSMYPALDDGYIVAVDTSVNEPEHLVGHMVVARHADEGVTIKWLRRLDKDYILEAQAPDLEPLWKTVRVKSGWIIVGEVIWWIGKPK